MILQKPENMHKKDGSSVRPKISMLEKAIRELEKMVAECKFGNCLSSNFSYTQCGKLVPKC